MRTLNKPFWCIFVTTIFTSSFFIYTYLFLPFEETFSRLLVNFSNVVRSLTPFITVIIVICAAFLILTKVDSVKPYAVLCAAEFLLFTAPAVVKRHPMVLANVIVLLLGFISAKVLAHFLRRTGSYSGPRFYAGFVICSFHMILQVANNNFNFPVDMTESLHPWALLIVIGVIVYECSARNIIERPEPTAMVIPVSVIDTVLLAMAVCIILNNNDLRPFLDVLKFGGLPAIAFFMCFDRFWLPDHSDAILFLD